MASPSASDPQSPVASVPSAASDPSAASVRGLDLRLPGGVHALRGVDLEIGKGEIVSLVGESGSGKTMLGLSLLGLAPAEARFGGEAWLGDTEMCAADEDERRLARRAHAGAVFQDPMTSLNPTMKIGAQIGEAAASREAVVEALEQVGFPEPARRLNQYPHELSGGLRQRVMIAMAIVRRPSLILLDEPTTALDVTLQRTTLRLLRRLRDELGMAMLFITHDLAVAGEVADRAVVLYGGRIAETGTPRDVFTSPSHPYTAGLLGSRLALAGGDRDEELETLAGEPPDPRQPPPGCPFEPRCSFARAECARELPPLVPASRHGGSDACLRSVEIAPQLEEGARAARRSTAAADVAPKTDESSAALTVTGLDKSFRSRRHTHRAVASVSLAVPAGGALALVGESGCGKTTILRIAVGLERADRGEVAIGSGGRPQMVFQDAGSSLTPWLTVGALLEERLRGQGLDGEGRSRRIEETLTMVGLSSEVATTRPGRLSGGQRQRVALARAVIVPPALLACDEPTSALDVSLAAVVINLLRRLRRELGVALLFVTHDLAVARAIADEIAVMAAGEIVERGPADEVLERPRSDEAKRLLEAVPSLERTWT
ncbi:MAG: ABC transporter ATP-binding protein [Actinobacteria bacterium]|nr:ABC transporter ATP-binding protein [Actinomycetota bacterium]